VIVEGYYKKEESFVGIAEESLLIIKNTKKNIRKIKKIKRGWNNLRRIRYKK